MTTQQTITMTREALQSHVAKAIADAIAAHDAAKVTVVDSLDGIDAFLNGGVTPSESVATTTEFEELMSHTVHELREVASEAGLGQGKNIGYSAVYKRLTALKASVASYTETPPLVVATIELANEMGWSSPKEMLVAAITIARHNYEVVEKQAEQFAAHRNTQQSAKLTKVQKQHENGARLVAKLQASAKRVRIAKGKENRQANIDKVNAWNMANRVANDVCGCGTLNANGGLISHCAYAKSEGLANIFGHIR